MFMETVLLIPYPGLILAGVQRVHRTRVAAYGLRFNFIIHDFIKLAWELNTGWFASDKLPHRNICPCSSKPKDLKTEKGTGGLDPLWAVAPHHSRDDVYTGHTLSNTPCLNVCPHTLL
ncbi:hypothetical protein TNCV_1619601 [Trichonephila clavipes]|nr:hypothetical protein TNCV_1619601 [Trichonephila clavipes]